MGKLWLKWTEIRFLFYWVSSIQLWRFRFLWMRLRGRGKEINGYVERVSRGWSLVIFKMLGCRIEISGSEHLPRTGPLVVMSNHQSRYDIPLLVGFLERDLAFVAKRELYRVPFLSYWMKMLRGYSLDRQKPEESGRAYEALAEQMVRDGQAFIIFPEGTRSRDPEGRIQPMKRGSLRLAEARGLPVLPVSLDGTRLLDNISALKRTPAGERILRLKVAPPVTVPEGLSAPQRRDLIAALEKTIVSNWETIRVHWDKA